MAKTRSAVLFKLFDCAYPLPWPFKQRLILLLRLLCRRSISTFWVISCSDCCEKGQETGTLEKCLRDALMIEKQSRKTEEDYIPPVVVQGEEFNPEINDSTLDPSEERYTVLLIFGDNMKFLEHLLSTDTTKTVMMPVLNSGFASMEITNALDCFEANFNELYSGAIHCLIGKRDEIVWVDLRSTEKVYDSLVEEQMQSNLCDGEKLQLFINWGLERKACTLINKLKATQRGRELLKERFWSTFIHFFCTGDAKSVDTITYHEVVDLMTEMSQQRLYEIYQGILTKQPNNIFCAVLRFLDTSSELESHPDWAKVHCVMQNYFVGSFLILEESLLNIGQNNLGFLFEAALLMLNKDLSLVIWRRLDNRILFSLAAGITLLRLSKLQCIKKCVNRQATLCSLKDFYEDELINITNAMACDDFVKLQKFILGQISDNFRPNVLVAAQMANFQRFFAQRAVLDLIQEVWAGTLKYSSLNELTITMGVVCPLIVPFFKIESNPDRVKYLHVSHTYKTRSSDDKTDRKPPNVLKRIHLFYMAPKTKFLSNLVSFVTFVLSFSYFLLSDQRFSPGPTYFEYCLFVFVFSLLVEECFQLFHSNASLIQCLKSYVADHRNWYEVAIIALFNGAFFIRCFGPADVWGYRMAHITDMLYVTCLLLCYFRILYFLVTFRSLGPYIIMLSFMLDDFRAFLIIMVIMILGFGVGIEAMLSGEGVDGDSIWTEFSGFLIKPTMQMYGFSLFLEDIADAYNCTVESSSNLISGCADLDVRPYFVVMLSFLFYLFTGVILMNLLIAIFSDTYSRVRENTSLYFNYVFYQSTVEYTTRAVLPCPLSLLERTVNGISWVAVAMYKAIVPRALKHKPSSRAPGTSVKMNDSLRIWAKSVENQYVVDKYFENP